jgi:hypothetical protein
MANRKPSPEKDRKRYAFRFSLTSLILSCIGFLLILGWVFALGIMVGRGFLLGTALDTLSVFKHRAVKDEKRIKDEHVPLIREEELTFYRELIDKKEKAKKEVLPQGFPQDKGRPTPGIEIPQKTEGAGTYSVQVAALKDREKTEKMVEGLLRSGYSAYYYQVLINGEAYYRVRCGPFSTVDQAKRYEERLAKEEGFKPFIVYPGK